MRTRVLLTALTLLSSLTSFAAYTLLLRQLGASEAVDLLFYAASVPMATAGLASGVLLYLLPPRFTRTPPRMQAATVRGLSNAVLLVLLLATLLAAAMLLGGRSPMFWLVWTGFVWAAGLSLMMTAATCVAQARAAYLPTGTAPMLASVGLFLGVVAAVLSRLEWLMPVGQLLGMLVATTWLFRRMRLSARPMSRRQGVLALAGLRPLRGHAVAITLATTAFTLFQPIDTALCSMLGSGALSVMAYAQRVLVAVSTVISLGAHAIAARTSHDTYRSGGHAALCRQANRESTRIVGMGLAVAALYWLGLDRVLVGVLSSAQMSAADVDTLRSCLGWMLLGVGPMATAPYLFRVFYAIAQHAKPACIGVCVPVVYGALALAMLPSLGILALALAYALVWWLALLAALLWLNRMPPVAGGVDASP